MGCWSENILGNDIAMDMICAIESEYNKSYDIQEALEKNIHNNNYRYNEGKLAIAYAELCLTGNVIITNDKQNLLDIIDKELSKEILDNWNDEYKDKRIRVLQQFKEQINLKVNDVKKTRKEIEEWFQKTHDVDVFNKGSNN